jgi:hypothetical protein
MTCFSQEARNRLRALITFSQGREVSGEIR